MIEVSHRLRWMATRDGVGFGPTYGNFHSVCRQQLVADLLRHSYLDTDLLRSLILRFAGHFRPTQGPVNSGSIRSQTLSRSRVARSHRAAHPIATSVPIGRRWGMDVRPIVRAVLIGIKKTGDRSSVLRLQSSAIPARLASFLRSGHAHTCFWGMFASKTISIAHLCSRYFRACLWSKNSSLCRGRYLSPRLHGMSMS